MFQRACLVKPIVHVLLHPGPNGIEWLRAPGFEWRDPSTFFLDENGTLELDLLAILPALQELAAVRGASQVCPFVWLVGLHWPLAQLAVQVHDQAYHRDSIGT